MKKLISNSAKIRNTLKRTLNPELNQKYADMVEMVNEFYKRSKPLKIFTTNDSLDSLQPKIEQWLFLVEDLESELKKFPVVVDLDSDYHIESMTWYRGCKAMVQEPWVKPKDLAHRFANLTFAFDKIIRIELAKRNMSF